MWGYPKYIPVAQKKNDAAKQLEKLKKKNPAINPVIINGTKVANTWWGIAWNKNLESYADYANRIGRGRSYVRNGFVLDLSIETGVITALVQGSGRSPYKVQITIAPLSKQKWEDITKICSHSIASMEELAAGKFPKKLETLFTQKDSGLFPTPKEIRFDCSCPDWADMCKHVAAALYGVGARLDQDPFLFFKLRDINFESLLKKSIEEKMHSMLKNADKKSARVMDEADVEELFNISKP